MREINYRGYAVEKLIKNTQWIDNGYGVANIEYVDGTNSVYLITPYGDYLVEEESVGQYTGFKDKNDVKIYEGDIIEIESGIKYKVVFNRGCFKVQNIEYLNSNLYLLEDYNFEYIRVIGTEFEMNKEE